MPKTTARFITLILVLLLMSSSLNAGDRRNSDGAINRAAGISASEYLPGAILLKIKAEAKHLHSLEYSTTSGIASIDAKIQRFAINRVEQVFPTRAKKIDTNLPDLASIYRFEYSAPFDAAVVARAFASDPNIEYAEPIFIQHVHAEPNDPLYPQQWYLQAVKAAEGWDIEQGDSQVILAIIDSGVDTDHPDLLSKIWVNSEEIPGNGIDDDGNGFIDDISGWNFVKNNGNPNPSPDGIDNNGDGIVDGGVDHGTSMAGFAAAATNNLEGIAGLGWNCTIMPILVMNDEGSGFTDVISQGIRYAADNGAHVINLSLGGSQFSETQRQVIEYAYQKGAVVVAAAGNQNYDQLHYPAAYPKVVAVGGTANEADLRSSISNFGIFVDVMAPGGDFNLRPPSEMISTVYYDPAFGFKDYYRARTKEGYLTAGTSSSSALVSGLMGLVISQHPEWTNEQVIRQVVLTADNIDNINPNFSGRLGSGRINSNRALTENNLTDVSPRIKLLGEVTFSDAAGGDNDNIFERGETIDVTVSAYRNYSISPAYNAVLTLTTNDTDLTVIDGILNYGIFPADTAINITNGFSFKVNDNARGKTAEMYLGWQADGGYSVIDTFKVIVGKVPILIVADDFDPVQGYDHFPESEKIYTNIIRDVGLNYAVWERRKLGPLQPEQISNFPLIIWNCGWSFPSLDADDRTSLSYYLENGGSLFISGQDIGWDLCDPGTSQESPNEYFSSNGASKIFYEKYLHAIYLEDDSPINQVVGIPGDPIGDGLQFSAWQPGLPEIYQFPDEIEPAAGATAVFEYLGGKNHKFGIKYAGDHRVVYFGMGFEAIDANEFTKPTDVSPIRTEVLTRTLNWLNFIEHQRLTDTENSSDPRTVIAQVMNSFALSDLIQMELHWKKETDVAFTIVPMQSLDSNKFSAEIPAPGENITIQYFIKLNNTYYDWSTPQEAPTKLFSYFVGPDQAPPTFSHIPLKSSINGKDPRQLSVGVTDNSEIDAATVYVQFMTKTVSDSLLLTSSGNSNLFQGALLPIFAYGDTVRYYFSAYDKARTPNRGQSDVYTFIVGFEDFESGLTHWTTSPNGWGLEKIFYYSGENSINDSPGGNYPLNRDVSIATNFGIDLSKASHAALTFWTRYFLEINRDFGYIEVSNDGGLSWNKIGSAINGVSSFWKQQTVSLSNFCGAGNTDVRIRFRMTSDNNQGPPFQGWFIDDVQIVEGLDVTAVSREANIVIPDKYTLYQNFPNPFNPTTTIQFDLPSPGNVALKIYNIRGELVRTLIQEQLNFGAHRVAWDGSDDHGRLQSSGVYFYKLETKDFNAVRKLVLIK